MTNAELQAPPPELELSWALAHSHNDDVHRIIRRLAFQRDALLEKTRRYEKAWIDFPIVAPEDIIFPDE